MASRGASERSGGTANDEASYPFALITTTAINTAGVTTAKTSAHLHDLHDRNHYHRRDHLHRRRDHHGRRPVVTTATRGCDHHEPRPRGT